MSSYNKIVKDNDVDNLKDIKTLCANNMPIFGFLSILHNAITKPAHVCVSKEIPGLVICGVALIYWLYTSNAESERAEMGNDSPVIAESY